MDNKTYCTKCKTEMLTEESICPNCKKSILSEDKDGRVWYEEKRKIDLKKTATKQILSQVKSFLKKRLASYLLTFSIIVGGGVIVAENTPFFKENRDWSGVSRIYEDYCLDLRDDFPFFASTVSSKYDNQQERALFDYSRENLNVIYESIYVTHFWGNRKIEVLMGVLPNDVEVFREDGWNVETYFRSIVPVSEVTYVKIGGGWYLAEDKTCTKSIYELLCQDTKFKYYIIDSEANGVACYNEFIEGAITYGKDTVSLYSNDKQYELVFLSNGSENPKDWKLLNIIFAFEDAGKTYYYSEPCSYDYDWVVHFFEMNPEVQRAFTDNGYTLENAKEYGWIW